MAGLREPAARMDRFGDEDGVTAPEDEIFSAVTTALEPYRKEGTRIAASTDISQDLNLDSVAVLDLLMELEEKFDVSIPLNLVPEIRTVGELADTVRRLKEG
jgi:acyl carrier protein